MKERIRAAEGAVQACVPPRGGAPSGTDAGEHARPDVAILPMVLSSVAQARLQERSRPRRSDFAEIALPDLPAVPGMIGEADKRYLFWLASRGYTGTGRVVEVGSWLGRSTTCLAAGLNEAGFPDALHCFDQFEWRPSHARKAALSLRVGENFQPLFERNVRPVYPGLRATKTTIRDLAWKSGPVEILFLDAPKRLGELSDVLAVFGPSLVPGLSLLVLQDYLHFPSYPVAAVMSRLSDHVELLHVVDGGSTVGFRVRKPLDCDLAQPIAWNFGRWTPEEALATWKRILEPLPARARAKLAPGLLLLLYDSHGLRTVRRILRECAVGELERAEWQKRASTHLYSKYWPVFKMLGIRPPRSLRTALVPLRWQLRMLLRGTVRATKRRAAAFSRRSR